MMFFKFVLLVATVAIGGYLVCGFLDFLTNLIIKFHISQEMKEISTSSKSDKNVNK